MRGIRFKKFTFNWLSIMVGIHYGRNPATGDRFLHVAPLPFIGLDYWWPLERMDRIHKEADEVSGRFEFKHHPVDDLVALGHHPEVLKLPAESIISREQARSMFRRIGICPLRTPRCKYSDCGPQPGRSCSGPYAPKHIDMSAGPGDVLE